MRNLIKYIAVILGGVLISTSVVFATSYPVSGQTYYLAGAGVTSTQSTIQLSSFTSADGTKITMSNFGTVGYGTLEPQSPSKVEFISFTGVTQNTNGSATLTGVIRGVGFVYPYSTSSSLQKAHSGGAQFIISNSASFYYNEFDMPSLANVTVWPFASTSPATKGYVDYVAFSGPGVINATLTQPGVIQVGTGAQAAVTNGATTPYLALTTTISTSTYNSNTAANKVPITGSTGKIDPNFLWKGNVVTLPSGNGSASSTILANDGAGSISWINQGDRTVFMNANVNQSTIQTSTTTIYTVPIPANTLNGSSNMLRVTSMWTETTQPGTYCKYGLDFGNGSATTTQVGFASNDQGAMAPLIMFDQIFASSTSGVAITNQGGTANSTAAGFFVQKQMWYGGRYAAADLTAKTYLGFNAAAGASAEPCKLNSVLVEVLSNQ